MIELSVLEVRHIAETCREMLRFLESQRGLYIPEIVLDSYEDDLKETLRILREDDHD